MRLRLRAASVAGTVVALLATAPARAGVPFVTDDPEPVDVNAWEVNSALTGTRQAAGTFAFLPQVDINYGAAPGLQLHIQPQLAYASTPQGRSVGVGDTEIGVKYRVTSPSETDGDLMVGLYPRVELPTGSASRNLGAGATSTYLPIWFQVTLGRWTGYGGGGYWINSASGSRNAWAAGWVALYKVTEGLQVGGEVYGKTADVVGSRSSTGFNLGAIYQLAKDTNLLFSAGRGLTDATATNLASLYLGVQVDY